MAQKHFLDQDDQNQVEHDFLGHVMPVTLASESPDAKSIINGTTAFLRSR